MKHRITVSSLLLCALLLASCGGTDVPSEAGTASSDPVGTETVTEGVKHLDALPSGLDFGGQKVNFYSGAYHEKYSKNFVGEQNGDILNDARFACERSVEERLNVEITEALGDSGPDVCDTAIKNMITSGDTTYQIYTNMDRFMIADVTNGMFRATSDLPYVDLDAKYWFSDMTREFSVGDKIYYALTAFNLYSYKNTQCIYMNLELADSLDIAPMYDLVREGKWTVDKMKETSALALSDLNGSGTFDADDQYGFSDKIAKNLWVNYAVACGCNTEIMSKDKNDYFVYGVSDKFMTVMDDVYRFYQEDKSAVFDLIEFPTGRLLYNEGALDLLEADYRDVKFRFSVLPMPKYSEEQEKYYCRTYDSHFTMVPVTTEDLDICGAVLEALSSQAYETVLPAYIDSSLKDKYCRDEDSVEMMQTILDTRTVFLAEAYLFETFGNHWIHEGFMKRASMTIASALDSRQAKAESGIASFNDYFHTVNEGN